MKKVLYLIFIGFGLIGFSWSWGQKSSLSKHFADSSISITSKVPVVREVWFGMSIAEVIKSEQRQPLLAKVIANDVNQKTIVYQEEVLGMTLLLYYLFVDYRLNSIMYYCILNCSQNNYAYVIKRMERKYGSPNLYKDDNTLQYTWQLISNQEDYLILANYQSQNAVNVEEPNSFTIGYTEKITVEQVPLTN